MDSTLGKNIEFPIKNADGSAFHDLVLHKATVDSVVMSLGDKITGDVYYKNNTLTVTMQEYIEYKGVRYVLVNPPTVVREGLVSDNSGLNGMTKYSFEFYHPMYMLGNFPFTDVAVKDDEEQYLAQNKTFSWIGTGLDFIVKLNANLRGTEWVVVESGNEQSHIKLQCLPNDVVHTKSEDNTTNGVLTFDQVFISDALKTMYDTWEVPFVIDSLHEGEYSYIDEHNVEHDWYNEGKRFVIVVGLPSNEILDEQGNNFVFQFGQGVGLKNNSRTPKNNKIVTRIAPIGSENNIPYGYPQIEWTGDQNAQFTIGDSVGVKYDVTIGGKHYDKAISYPIYDGILGGRRVKLIKHPFTRTTLMPSVYSQSVNKKVNPFAEDYDCDAPIIDYYDAIGGEYPHQIVQEAPSFEAHQFGDIKPELGEQYINGVYIDDIPNLIKSDLGKMPTKYPVLYNDVPQVKECLDKFKSAGTEQWQPMQNVQAFLAWLNETYLGSGALREVSSSDKWYLQYLYDAISEGRYTFTSEQRGANPLFNMSMQGDYFIYISYHSSNYINWDIYVWNDGVSPSHGVWDDTIGDDGNYIQSNFYLQLPQLDFDLYASAAITQEMQINMRSGDCMGCTFTVQVDWELYKANFYRSDGTFDPEPHVSADDGHVRDLSLFPDSSRGAIDILVQKDSNTFGKLMPNQYLYPKANDQFVVLGISLPTSYITNAEERLDDAAKEYMLENNVYHYEYPLKFDEYFLATHTDILSQMRNNTIVRFMYAGLLNVLYIKQITVKYGDKVLPQYDITLTDDVEIVLNQIGQVTDDVSRVRVQMNELQKYYGEDVVKQINEKLSRVADDVALGRITFQQGITVIGDTIFNGALQSPNFAQGLYDGSGWKIDALGNAELESLRVRSFLEVIELLVNRMQAQEGDTMFTDNDQIDFVERRVDETDQSVSYILTLKEKWDGYITSQMYGNVLRGIINTLAAKDAGVSDVSEQQTVEADGSNSYFTSWMRVIATHNTDNTLSPNQIRVVLYGDNETPAQRNFEPCELMNIARWGCINYKASDAANYAAEGLDTIEAIQASIKRRQQVFYISTSEGRIVKLNGVDAPILRNGNYGTTLGELPDFVKAYPKVAERLVEGGDYLYAQGVVVGDFIKINKEGLPVPTVVFCGEWVDGSQMQNPTPRNGIYFYNQWNEDAQQYEIHEVRHNGGRWQCLQSQPVISGGVATYYPPKWNSPYWSLVDGNDNLTIEFVSSKGYSFRRGNVDTVITPHLFYGNVDITDDVAAQYWNWTRTEEHPTPEDIQWDENWRLQHQGQKTLHLTNADIPASWSSANKVIFTCTVTVNDGKSTIIVDNQIIS